MDTDVKIFNCNASQTSPEAILSSGETFSGSIYFDDSKNNWVVFDLVNRETMRYILDDITFNKEVKFEIFSYAKDSKIIQRPCNWDEPI